MPGAVRPDTQRPADSDVTERTPIPWGRVFRWLVPYWRAEVVLVGAMTAGIFLSLVYPWLMRSIVDDVIDAGRRDLLWPLAGGIFAATAAGVILSGAAGWLQTWVTSRVLVDLRLAAFGHLQGHPPEDQNNVIVDHFDISDRKEGSLGCIHGFGLRFLSFRFLRRVTISNHAA